MRTRKIIVYAIALSLILLPWACKKEEPNRTRLITVHGKYAGVSGIDFLFRVINLNDSIHYISIPIQTGDAAAIVGFYDNNTTELPDTLYIDNQDSVLYVNHKLVGIEIFYGFPSGVIYPSLLIKEMSDDEIEYIKYISIDDSISADAQNALKQIAGINPKLDITIETDSAALGSQCLDWLLQYFTPEHLSLGFVLDSLQLLKLSHLNSVKSLTLNVPLSWQNKVLPHFASLEQISLFNNFEDSLLIGNDFFSKNLQLEKLNIIGIVKQNSIYTPWHKLSHLKQFSILMYGDTLDNYPYHQFHPHLERLSIFGDPDVTSILKLKKLRWLAYGGTLSTEVLNKLSKHPTIETLVIRGVDSLMDYSSLKNLKHLEYLIIVDELNRDTTLFNLKNLSYLSIPEELYYDSARFATLQKALPKAIITPNHGGCMGSGWLLILLPLSGVWFLFHKAMIKIKHAGRDGEITNI